MFVVASDDLNWCRVTFKNHSDVIVVDKATGPEDMALLSSLDHQIYSVGSFGLWINILSKAETVVYPAPMRGDPMKRYRFHGMLDKINSTSLVALKF